jgi:hypothetical protein
MDIDNLLEIPLRDMIRVDYRDNIPRNNPILEARRKRLDELSRSEELKYQEFQRSLQSREPEESQESPTSLAVRYTHYIYAAYELAKFLLN